MSWQVSFGNRDTLISVFVFLYCATRGRFSRLFFVLSFDISLAHVHLYLFCTPSFCFLIFILWKQAELNQSWVQWLLEEFSSLYWLPDLATLIWVIWAGNWHIYRHLEQLHLITRIKLGGTPGLVSVYFLRPARFEPGGRWGHLPVMSLLRGCGVVDQL